jgi:formylglycine-generating enzyme required for sulfatase activity
MKEQAQKKLAVGGLCRLPTEAEWAYAANLNGEGEQRTQKSETSSSSVASNYSASQTNINTNVAPQQPQSQTPYEQSIATNLNELNKINDSLDQKHKCFWSSIFKRRPKSQRPPRQQTAISKEQRSASTSSRKKARQQPPVVNRAEVEPDAFLPLNTMDRRIGKYGLSDMANNVSEWTATSYYDGGMNFETRFNPDLQWSSINSESKYQRRKVVRGGSWKDIPRYKTFNNRFYSDMYDDHSYIGFRVVVVNLPE